jgi:nucleoside-diphosphate-sugar epimerase
VQERFLITGGLGCIGAWIIAALVEQDVDVVVLDASIDERRLYAIVEPERLAKVLRVRGDVTDVDGLADLLRRHEINRIIHLAGLQTPACRADPVRAALVNVGGTAAVFQAARDVGFTGNVVYASSAATYALADGERIAPAHPSGVPTSLYGAYKLANEQTARVFAAEGVASIGLRPFVVYGVGRDAGATAAPTEAMRAAAVGDGYHIPYGGRTQMHFAPDVASAFIAAARAPVAGAQRFNVPGEIAAMGEVVAAIEAAAPSVAGMVTFDPEPIPFPQGLDAHEYAAAVGPLELTPLEEGVRRTVEHFRHITQPV